jgi:hypothetical protein
MKVPEGVGPDRFGDACLPGGAFDDPGGAVPAHPGPVRAEEDRPVEPFPDRQVDRPRGPRGERDGDDLAALPQDRQGPVAAFETERVDISTQGFADPQPVDRQQRDQGVPAAGPRPAATSSAPTSLRSNAVA